MYESAPVAAVAKYEQRLDSRAWTRAIRTWLVEYSGAPPRRRGMGGGVSVGSCNKTLTVSAVFEGV